MWISTQVSSDNSIEVHFIKLDSWDDFELILRLLVEENRCEVLNVVERKDLFPDIAVDAAIKTDEFSFILRYDDYYGGNRLFSSDPKLRPELEQLANNVLCKVKSIRGIDCGTRSTIVKESQETIIVCYEGAYGPTIRIDTQSKEWLEYLKSEVTELIEEGREELEISKMDFVSVSDLKSLLLRKCDGDNSTISELSRTEEVPSFIWLQSSEELITINGLIDGLLVDEKPGHQYLTSESDGVLIVLAYKERRG